MGKGEIDYNKRQTQIQVNTYLKLKSLYDETLTSILANVNLSNLPADERIRLERHADISKRLDAEIDKLSASIYAYIKFTTRESWDLANEKATELLNTEFTNRGLKVPTGMKVRNIADYNTFARRKTAGITISARVWNIGKCYKKEIEEAINAAVEKGKSANELARDIKRYLNNPDARYRHIRDKAGQLKLSANALRYNPGQGVYRSAFQNALRLARNEINRAFHESEHERWQKMPFIIGYTVNNSRNRVSTVCPICESIDGVAFPKSVQVLPVHIACMCHARTIQCTDEEFEKISAGYIPKEIPLVGRAKEHVEKYGAGI